MIYQLMKIKFHDVILRLQMKNETERESQRSEEFEGKKLELHVGKLSFEEAY